MSFSRKEEAQAAKNSLCYTEIKGQELRICFKRNPQDFRHEANIFVRNLPESLGGRQLEELCQPFGEVLSCTVRRNDEGKSLLYGYVQFSSEEEAFKAIEGLNEKTVEGCVLLANKFVPHRQRYTK